MKRLNLLMWYKLILLSIFGLIVLQGPIDVVGSVLLPHLSLVIKSWAEILMLFAAILGVILVSNRHLWRWFFRSPLILVALGSMLLHLLLVPYHYHSANVVEAGLEIDLRYVLYFVLVLVLLKLAPDARRGMLKVGLIGACIVAGFGTFQVFLPANILHYLGYGPHTIEPYLTVDKNHSYIRINSTLRGPNPVGAYAVILIGALLAYILSVREALSSLSRRLVLGLLGMCSLVILWVSYSRSALVAAFLAVGIVLGLRYGRRLPKAMWCSLGAGIVAIAILLVIFSHSGFISNVVLHNNPRGGSALKSDMGHIQSLQAGGRLLMTEPLGGGIGSTGSASLLGSHPRIIEDQFLFVAHEAGWLGLLLFCGLLYLIFSRLWQTRRDWLSRAVLASGIGLIFIGVLLPVWTDDTISIVWWGLAALAVGGTYESTK